MNRFIVREKIQQFLAEDIGSGDVTTDAVFSPEDKTKGQLIAKGEGNFCGGPVLQEGLALLDPQAEINLHVAEGEALTKGQVIAEVSGSTRALLSGERVLLNLVQRMSGIATATKRAVAALNDDNIRVCDTRKTIPGLRMFDKYAVHCGGGSNHRFGLYDAAMIKDNHIAAAGGITEAVTRVKESAGHMVKIEIETTNEQEVQEAVRAGADVIMFDNTPPATIKEWMKHIPEHIETEASGNVTLDNIAEYRGCGVTYISLGSLTHSVTACDISFLL